jgi:hypothetical protein
MTDSLKLAVASLLMLGVASTDYLAHLPWGTAATVGFVLYFVWPVLSIAMLCLTALFAIRDFQGRRRAQAALALFLGVAVVGVTFARFHGWE